MNPRSPSDQDAELAVPPTDPQGPGTGSTDAEQLVELNALLGRGTRYEGKLHFEGRIRIEGQFSGDIRGEEILVIGEGAEVDGSIRVGVCIVTGGTVRADIRASRAIELHVPAVVVGDLHAPAIFIDRGVQFEGSCKMAPLDATPAPPGSITLPQPSPPPQRAATQPSATAPAPGRTLGTGAGRTPVQPGGDVPSQAAADGSAATTPDGRLPTPDPKGTS